VGITLVDALEQEKSAGKQGRLTLSLLQIDLVILDELGYLPFSQARWHSTVSLALRTHQRDLYHQPHVRRIEQRFYRC